MQVVIIGGGSAGTSCAFELRKLDKDSEIIIVEQSIHHQYSPCALPYVLSDEIKSFDNLFTFNQADYEKNNIKILLTTRVLEINRQEKTIVVKKEAAEKTISYDKLVIATGSSCFVPAIKGLDNVDYFLLKTIDDAKKIYQKIKENDKTVIIGAGMVGFEVANALAKQGEKVYLLEKKASILPNMLDADMASKFKDLVPNINILENCQINEIIGNKIILDNQEIIFDKLIVTTGVIPNIQLAKQAGLVVNKGIVVNDYLQTNDTNIYAIGDCAMYLEFNSNKKIANQLGSIALRQGKLVARNILGAKEKFPFLLNNTISKVGDWQIGAVGLTQRKAEALEKSIVISLYGDSLRAKYYSNEEIIIVKLLCDFDGVLLGGQIIANNDVAGRLNLLSMAITNKMVVKELSKLETCYNPAITSINDPIVICAENLAKKVTFLKNKECDV